MGEDPFDLESIHMKMDAVVPRNLIAKCGIDLALWDIMGKATQEPAYKLLGGQFQAKILCTYTLSGKYQNIGYPKFYGTSVNTWVTRNWAGSYP
jgi:L-alanine-DL-glutamate epimerase-like enolase superfamily enzyme